MGRLCDVKCEYRAGGGSRKLCLNASCCCETHMNEAIRATAAPAQPLFNPLSPDFIRDPYPFYARLRETDPMYLTPLKAYLASHNADVAMILRDRRFGKDFEARTV